MPEPRHGLKYPFRTPPAGSFLDKFTIWADLTDLPDDRGKSAFADLFRPDIVFAECRSAFEAAGLAIDDANPAQRALVASTVGNTVCVADALWSELTADRPKRAGSPGLNPMLCLVALCEVVRLGEEGVPHKNRWRIAAGNLGPGIRPKHVRRAVCVALRLLVSARQDVAGFTGSGAFRGALVSELFDYTLQSLRDFRELRAA